MNLKAVALTTITLTTLSLSSCLPVAEELTADNLYVVLAASRQASHVTEQLNESEEATRILSRFTTREITGQTLSCETSGSKTFEPIGDNQFSLDFINCTGPKGRIDGYIEGTVSLDLSAETVAFDYTAMNLVTEDPQGNVIVFNEIGLNTEWGWTTDQQYLAFAHNGTYDFDTRRYRGPVIAQTLETNHHSLADLSQCSGEVTYTDTSGNVLTVDRNGNGIDLYFNGVFVKSYDCLWNATN